jgi:hypothetical protein
MEGGLGIQDQQNDHSDMPTLPHVIILSGIKNTISQRDEQQIQHTFAQLVWTFQKKKRKASVLQVADMSGVNYKV